MMKHESKKITYSLKKSALSLTKVVSFESIGNKFFRLQVYAPEIASKIEAGQYVELAPPSGGPRPYSVANSDFSSGILEFHIERKPQSQSIRRLVFSCSNRSIIYISEPKGSVRLLNSGRGNIFISTGTAFSQINSLLGSLLLNKVTDQNPIQSMSFLFWLAEDPSERYMDRLAYELEERFEFFEYIPVNIDKEKFSFDSIFSSRLILSKYNFYVCSSFEKSQMLRDKLLEKGVMRDQILSDAF